MMGRSPRAPRKTPNFRPHSDDAPCAINERILLNAAPRPVFSLDWRRADTLFGGDVLNQRRPLLGRPIGSRLGRHYFLVPFLHIVSFRGFWAQALTKHFAVALEEGRHALEAIEAHVLVQKGA
jgi:hypothetical protein